MRLADVVEKIDGIQAIENGEVLREVGERMTIIVRVQESLVPWNPTPSFPVVRAHLSMLLSKIRVSVPKQ